MLMTTIDSVTRDQIRRLRTEAAEAGDLPQVELCDLAMGALRPLGDPGDGSDSADDRRTFRAALVECVRVLASAEAQEKDAAES